MNKNTNQKINELEEAKKNIIWLVGNADGLVDMHGLKYWAGVVENLREEIKKTL